MSVEVFLFVVVLVVALIVLPRAEPPRMLPDEVTPSVIMDLLQGPDLRRDGLRK